MSFEAQHAKHNCDTSLSVGIVCYRSEERVLSTLRLLRNSSMDGIPPIQIYVNGMSSPSTIQVIESEFPGISITFGSSNIGPGGARHFMLCNCVTTHCLMLDDDSYPITDGWNANIKEDLSKYGQSAAIAYPVIEYGKKVHMGADGESVKSFIGCAVVMDVASYSTIDGYLSIPNAYGVEEEDIALQFLERNMTITSSLSVLFQHDAELTKHSTADRVAATIANKIILGFVRYPLLGLPLVLYRVVSQLLYNIRLGRHRGNLSGVVDGLMWAIMNWSRRKPVSFRAMLLKYRQLS